jgi:hypothetical protein
MCIWTYPFDFFGLENHVNYNHVLKCMCAWVNYHLPYPLCMASTPKKKKKKKNVMSMPRELKFAIKINCEA